MNREVKRQYERAYALLDEMAKCAVGSREHDRLMRLYRTTLEKIGN